MRVDCFILDWGKSIEKSLPTTPVAACCGDRDGRSSGNGTVLVRLFDFRLKVCGAAKKFVRVMTIDTRPRPTVRQSKDADVACD